MLQIYDICLYAITLILNKLQRTLNQIKISTLIGSRQSGNIAFIQKKHVCKIKTLT